MNKGTLWTIVGVILAIVIAWFIVNTLFSIIAFLVRVIIVGVVAILVFLALRGVFARSSKE